jgi:hypothetical protein
MLAQYFETISNATLVLVAVGARAATAILPVVRRAVRALLFPAIQPEAAFLAVSVGVGVVVDHGDVY